MLKIMQKSIDLQKLTIDSLLKDKQRLELCIDRAFRHAKHYPDECYNILKEEIKNRITVREIKEDE